jgi:hypothetical protein
VVKNVRKPLKLGYIMVKNRNQHQLNQVPSRSVILASRMYTKPNHSGAKIAAPVCKALRRYVSIKVKNCYRQLDRWFCSLLLMHIIWSRNRNQHQLNQAGYRGRPPETV